MERNGILAKHDTAPCISRCLVLITGPTVNAFGSISTIFVYRLVASPERMKAQSVRRLDLAPRNAITVPDWTSTKAKPLSST